MSKWPGPVSALWGPPGDDTSPWRIALTCVWDDALPRLGVCGLNPSTATPIEPDPTCVRWLGMAQRWGFGSLTVVNLYPLRATKPKDLESSRFAIAGHDARLVTRYPEPFKAYLATVTEAINACSILLCSWGAVAGGDRLLRTYYEPVPPLAYLHKTGLGCPIHPLARLKGVEVSTLRPRDWITGEFVPLPIDGETPCTKTP